MLKISATIFCIYLPTLLFGQQDFQSPEKDKVIKKVCAKIEKEYVSTLIGKEISSSLYKKHTSGSYDKINDLKTFSDSITKHLQAISQDKHLALVYKEYSKKMKDSIYYPIKHHPITNVKMLTQDIGYIKINSFFFHKHALSKALEKINTSKAMIIDLRNNIGGLSSITNYALSYFLKGEINYAEWYTNENKLFSKSKTLSHVRGKKFLNIPLFILVNEKTFSAGEAFAYHMQAQNRATIIGDTTSGGAHAKRHIHVDKFFFLSLPEFRSISCVTGTDWEGIGVVPDIIKKNKDLINSTVALISLMKID